MTIMQRIAYLALAFSLAAGLSFAFIWAGAIVYAFGAWRRLKMVKVEA